jgi:ribosomal protein S18 acetylase RimI-like enzyme
VPVDGPQVRYRLARETDLERTYEVMLEAEGDLARGHEMSLSDLTIPDKRRGLAARAASLRDFPDRFWVAEVDDVVIGFGIAYLRGRYWHLKSLQVVPARQGRGVGRELMRRCAVGIPRDSVRSVVAETIQPISNALYLRAGMAPRLVIYSFAGDPGRSTGPLAGVATAATDRELDGLDSAVLGYARPDAHRLWREVTAADGRIAVRTHGELVGYAYLAADGTIGPALARSARHLDAVVRASMRRIAEGGGSNATLLVPATLRPVIRSLFDARFQVGPVSLVFMASRTGRGFGLQVFSPDGVL